MSNNFNKGLYETIYEHLDIHPDVKNLSIDIGKSKHGDNYKKFKLKNNKVDNFDPNRLQLTAEDAYPLPNSRPRGSQDISSVKFYQNQIQQQKDITPIWMVYQNNKYILLDGAHRIVASYIENIEQLNAYIIYNS